MCWVVEQNDRASPCVVTTATGPRAHRGHQVRSRPRVKTNASTELPSELLGHTDTKITVQHYIQRSEMVNPATAALLDPAFTKDEE